MYSEETELNTKTMYVCSFEISIVSLHAASGDPGCPHKFNLLPSKLYLKKSSVWSIMSPMYLATAYVHLIQKCMLLALHNRDSQLVQKKDINADECNTSNA